MYSYLYWPEKDYALGYCTYIMLLADIIYNIYITQF